MPPPPLRQSQKIHENLCNAKCQDFFIYKKITQIVFFFAKLLFFVYLNSQVTLHVIIFVYKSQLQNVHEKSHNVKFLTFYI